MAMQLGHVHIKTREDPQKVAKFYIDNFGATVKREIPGRGCQLDLHGVQLNFATFCGSSLVLMWTCPSCMAMPVSSHCELPRGAEAAPAARSLAARA